MSDAAEYDARARQHMPTDIGALKAEIMRLLGDGLKPRDIADALRMQLHEVIGLIAWRAS